MVLGPGRDRTGLFGASPDPLAPPHQHPSAEAWRVVQAYDPTPVADRDHTTGAAAGEDRSVFTSTARLPSLRTVTARTWTPSTPKSSSVRAPRLWGAQTVPPCTSARLLANTCGSRLLALGGWPRVSAIGFKRTCGLARPRAANPFGSDGRLRAAKHGVTRASTRHTEPPNVCCIWCRILSFLDPRSNEPPMKPEPKGLGNTQAR